MMLPEGVTDRSQAFSTSQDKEGSDDSDHKHHPTRNLGPKPSLAERNRERQQRFRLRQKTRIEELEARCTRLTSQARALAAEKEDLATRATLLKNLLQVRDLQLVAVTSQLAQYLPNGQAPEGLIKHEVQSTPVPQEGDAQLNGFQQLEGAAAQLELQPSAIQATEEDGPMSTETEAAHEPAAEQQGSENASQLVRPVASSPPVQLTLEQLCRVAEMQTAAAQLPEHPAHASDSPAYFSTLTRNYGATADVLLVAEGLRMPAHSAFLAAHSEFFFKRFQELRHSQPLYTPRGEPLVVEAPFMGKRAQDVELFVRHIYQDVDLETVADADVMRLVMLADEFEAQGLLRKCDEVIATRAEGKRFRYFLDLSSGGDVLDWILLADRLGLERVCSVCEMHLARYLKENRTWRENARLNELGQDCLLRVITKLAEL